MKKYILALIVVFWGGCSFQEKIYLDIPPERAPAFVPAKPDYKPTKILDHQCPTTRPKIYQGDDGTGWWRYKNY